MTTAFITTPPRALAVHSLRRPSICPSNRFRVVARKSTRARFMMSDAPTKAVYATQSEGPESTMEYRLFFKDAAKVVSPWHDIPLYPDPNDNGVVNFVNEIPRGTSAKMEIATDELSNPIKQDIKKGNLRFYKYGDSLINYGAIPQTWEDPNVVNDELQVAGDGDPVDVCEIGSTQAFGDVYPVKVLGCLGLLDEGEIDWKVIAINTADPNANLMNDIEDVEKVMPGVVGEVREWFRMYKTAEGKGENEYAYGGEAKGAQFAKKVIEETHQSWRMLKDGKVSNHNCVLESGQSVLPTPTTAEDTTGCSARLDEDTPKNQAQVEDGTPIDALPAPATVEGRPATTTELVASTVPRSPRAKEATETDVQLVQMSLPKPITAEGLKEALEVEKNSSPTRTTARGDAPPDLKPEETLSIRSTAGTQTK